MVTGRQEPPEIGVFSSSNRVLESQADLEWLERHTGPGLFTHEIYRRLVEQPVPLTRDHLAKRLLQEQEIGTLRFRERRRQSRGDDDQADDPTDGHPYGGASAGFLETIPVYNLPGSPLQTDEQDNQTSDEPLGVWALLRRPQSVSGRGDKLFQPTNPTYPSERNNDPVRQ